MVSNYITQNEESHTMNMHPKRFISDVDVGAIYDTGGDSIKRPRNYEPQVIQSGIVVSTDSTGPSHFDFLSSESCSGRDPSRQRSGTSYESPLPSLPFSDPHTLVHNTHNRPSALGSHCQPTEAFLRSGQQDGSHPLEIDTCYGVVHIEECEIRLAAAKRSKSPKEVELLIHANSVMIQDPATKDFVGFIPPLAASVLNSLANGRQVTFAAAVHDSCILAVTIYGPRANGDMIGNFLSQNKYFLQTPDQYDSSVPYINPQVLLRPGRAFESWHSSNEVQTLDRSTQVLNSAAKSKINEVLDSCAASTTFREVHATDRLTTDLKVHQKIALSVMMEKESGNISSPIYPSLWEEINNKAGQIRYRNTVTGASSLQKPSLTLGGILADDMGLGKTLTTLALAASTSAASWPAHPPEHEACKPSTLIIAPLSTLPNWEREIKIHFKRNSIQSTVYQGPKRRWKPEDLQAHEIVLTTYDTVRADSSRALKTKGIELGPLHQIHWFRIILDEAHIIRNRKSDAFHAVASLQSRHRWCLTGTPIQNSIDDLGSLVGFLGIFPFESAAKFRNIFTIPIRRNDTRGWERLTSLIKAILLRRTKQTENSLNIPPRHDYTQAVVLTPREKATYNIMLRSLNLGLSTSSHASLFQTILRLRQVCNSSALLPKPIQQWLIGALKSAESAPSELLAIHTCESCHRHVRKSDFDGPATSGGALPCFHLICRDCLTINGEKKGSTYRNCPICSGGSPLQYVPEHYGEESLDNVTSSKIEALLQNLSSTRKNIETEQIKSLVFSSWTGMLDLIGTALSRSGIVYQRIDGSKTLEQRKGALRAFGEEAECAVLLASLGSAAVGLNLTVASHVHLMEPNWNPMLERQAFDRVHRLGQTRPVKIWKYVIQGGNSIEEHIIKVQQRKLELISSSIESDKSPETDMRASMKSFIDHIELSK